MMMMMMMITIKPSLEVAPTTATTSLADSECSTGS